MTWTYDGDPESSDRDAVRLKIGDTDTDDQQLTDEEIAYLLTEGGSVLGAALAAVRAILAKYARLVDKSTGDFKMSYSQRLKSYQALETQLKKERAPAHGLPIAGGLSKARKDTVKDDDDRVDPAFARDQFRHPGTESDDDNDLLLDA